MDKLNKKTITYISIAIIVIIATYYFFIRKEDYVESNFNVNIATNENNTQVEENTLNLEKNTEEKILIYITGAVKNEGIYELEENSRIADCIEKAGGLTDEADIKDINLAYILEDGMKIYIPKINENKNQITDNTETYISKENSSSESTKITSKNEKININTATQTELETLPGIGTSTALKIINYRKENGKFNSIEDIKKVNGIGDSKFSQIEDLIKV